MLLFAIMKLEGGVMRVNVRAPSFSDWFVTTQVYRRATIWLDDNWASLFLLVVAVVALAVAMMIVGDLPLHEAWIKN